uniref:Uncharacterized protein n=1 Tax=Bubo bubo TaxID=30461 RepID=A0A8C0FPP1_BUBBB
RHPPTLKKQLPSPSCARGEAAWSWGLSAAKSAQENPPGAATGAQGYRAYLSSAPHYDFPRYRQLVHEITVAFSGISREVLCIAGRLLTYLVACFVRFLQPHAPLVVELDAEVGAAVGVFLHPPEKLLQLPPQRRVLLPPF